MASRHAAVAIILAAGDSTRMGHPKALTQVGSQTALAHIARAACQATGAPPRVVVGRHADTIRAAHPDLEVAWVVNPTPDTGRSGSLQRGLLLPPTPQTALVWPVDHPLATAATARVLLDTPGDWVVPSYQNRGGHPFVLRGLGISAAQTAPAAVGLRDALRGCGMSPHYVDVTDAGVRANLDTPEDLTRAGL